MSRYISELASKLKGNSSPSDTNLLTAIYKGPAEIQINGAHFNHNIHINPECNRVCPEGNKTSISSGDTVLVAQIGNSFYIICKVV